MIVFLCTFVLLYLAPTQASTQALTRPEWDDPAVLHVNTEKPHATMTIYPSAEAAASGRSPWVQSLNGRWKFKASAKPDARPGDFYRDDFDVSGWSEIAVPGSIETQGF